MNANALLVGGDGQYVVVGDGSSGVLATRVDAAGRVLDDPPLVIDARGEVRDIAFDGTSYFVVYVSDPVAHGYGSSLYGRRLAANDAELRLLDETPILISRAEFPLSGWIYDASLAFGDGNYLVAWSRQYADTYDVATVRVTPEGFVAGSPISMSSTRDREESPRIAFDGHHFFVVWTAGRSIEGAFVDPATGDAGAALKISTSDELEEMLRPQIAWNGATYLIAWSIGVNYPANLRVVGTRLSVTGELVDGDPDQGGGFRVPTSSEAQAITGVDWDGRDFLVSWNEGFFGPCSYDPCPPPAYRMKFSRVDSGGRLLSGTASMIGNGVLQSHASNGQRNTLFAYESNGRQWLWLSQPRGRILRR